MQYGHRRNLANSSSGRSTSIVTSHVTNLPRQKSTHRHHHLLRHRHLHRHRHLLRHRHLYTRRAGVAVTRSTCEPHARPSHAVFVCGGYFSSLVRTTSWARTMRPSKAFRSLRPRTSHGNNGKSAPLLVAARRHPPSQPASFLQLLYVCSCTAARSTPGMLLLAGQYDHAARLVLLIGRPLCSPLWEHRLYG